MLYTTYNHWFVCKMLVRLKFALKYADFIRKWPKICISGTKNRVKMANTICWVVLSQKTMNITKFKCAHLLAVFPLADGFCSFYSMIAHYCPFKKY